MNREPEEKKSVEKGQEINANFKKKREPNSQEQLREDLIDPSQYREEKSNPRATENAEWPSREFIKRDRPTAP